MEVVSSMYAYLVGGKTEIIDDEDNEEDILVEDEGSYDVDMDAICDICR